MKEKVLIIDGDLIAYRFAAAGEQRSICAKHIKSKKERIFKTRTAFKEYLAEVNFEYVPEDYEIEDIQTVGDAAFTMSTINKFITKMTEFTWADRVEIYLGSGKTFRHALPLPSGYKNNREDSLRPLLLNDTRQYMVNKFGAVILTDTDLEVDDWVTIRSYEELEEGNEPVLVSNDKDAQQSQRIRVLNWQKDPWELKLIPELGTLYKEKTTIKGDGLRFLAYQTLAGDTADTYCGYELSTLKYGPTKAMNALLTANNEQEVLLVLISEFKRLYPEPFTYTDCHGVVHMNADWFDMLQMYWRCAYMKRSRNDDSDFIAFAKNLGVEV